MLGKNGEQNARADPLPSIVPKMGECFVSFVVCVSTHVRNARAGTREEAVAQVGVYKGRYEVSCVLFVAPQAF